jgi:CP family cyanate transporter-like MFS transporter
VTQRSERGENFWTSVILLWLAGAGLRFTILAVPPVIARIQADLHLSGTQIGVLNGLPVILFAAAALPGSLLIARFGALSTLIAGLVIAGVASGLRGAVLDLGALYAATVLMGAGIAIMQPALPSLVRQWLPQRIGFGTALFTNGLLVGETFPVALTLPVVLPLVGDSWRIGLVVWGIPLLVIAALLIAFAPRGESISAAAPAKWWPDWNNSLIWRIGFAFSSVNSVYFCTNAFLPGHLAAAGRADLTGAALTALNFSQIPASFALLAVAGRLERRVWPFVVSGLLLLACLAGVAFTASMWTIVFAAALGLVGAGLLTLGLTLPALLGAPADVGRMSAAMFAISYTIAVVTSVASGAAWDLTGSPQFAFVPIAVSALSVIVLTPTIRFHRP